jgi:xanthine dehydrogenase YagR molybdenum-binding subunit
MTASSVSPAVRDAAEQMKKKLIQSAAIILEKPEVELTYTAGTVFERANPENTVDINAIIGKTRERILVTTGRREANPEGYMTNTFGAQFAKVQVDVRTGMVKVLKIVAAHDIGRTLNRKLLENQFHGGIMQGLGFALMEERVLDDYTGRVLTTNLHDYKIPTVADTPEIEVIIVSEKDPMNSSTGVKGIGEPAIIPTAGAVANAVYNAIGVRIYDLPITPDKVLNALNT